MIDINKKYQTRDGQKVELITTRGVGCIEGYPVLGRLYFNGGCKLVNWTNKGEWFNGATGSMNDLIEVKED